MNKLWNWIKSLFTGDSIGVVWRTIFTAAKSTLAQMVSDPANQEAALNLVKQLADSRLTNGEKLTNDEKRKEFNAQLREWAKAAGKQLTEAAINALRENAVVAAKCEGCCEA